MTTLCLADLELEPCIKKHEPKDNTPSQLKLIQTLKEEFKRQGDLDKSSTDHKSNWWLPEFLFIKISPRVAKAFIAVAACL